MRKQGEAFKTVLFTCLALVCFAANSILCRLALSSKAIDPATFTAVRIFSGAAVLALIVLASRKQPAKAGNWLSGLMLFLYAIAFSLAYRGLSAGTGALLLFGAVQATMILGSILAKKHPTPGQWAGLLLAVGGLVWLVAPGLSAPPVDRALMMAAAGIAWGIYSIRGAGGADAVAATAGNFLRAAPFAAIPFAVLFREAHSSPRGLFLAALSGAVTSGLGYVFWYTALPSLGSIRAAVVQLTVPALAAAGGLLMLGEHLNSRLLLAGAIILSGVALAVLAGGKPTKRS